MKTRLVMDLGKSIGMIQKWRYYKYLEGNDNEIEIRTTPAHQFQVKL